MRKLEKVREKANALSNQTNPTRLRTPTMIEKLHKIVATQNNKKTEYIPISFKQNT
jgi:hypothetical protein